MVSARAGDHGRIGSPQNPVEREPDELDEVSSIWTSKTSIDRGIAPASLICGDTDEWHVRMTADRLRVSAPETQPWGTREFTPTGPFGNRIRIGRNVER